MLNFYLNVIRHAAIGFVLLSVLFILETYLLRLMLLIGGALSGSDKPKRRRTGRCLIEAVAWRASLGLSTKGRRVSLVRAASQSAWNAYLKGDMSEHTSQVWACKIQNQAFAHERSVMKIMEAFSLPLRPAPRTFRFYFSHGQVTDSPVTSETCELCSREDCLSTEAERQAYKETCTERRLNLIFAKVTVSIGSTDSCPCRYSTEEMEAA